jgi:hypothetical protein
MDRVVDTDDVHALAFLLCSVLLSVILSGTLLG